MKYHLVDGFPDDLHRSTEATASPNNRAGHFDRLGSVLSMRRPERSVQKNAPSFADLSPGERPER